MLKRVFGKLALVHDLYTLTWDPQGFDHGADHYEYLCF